MTVLLCALQCGAGLDSMQELREMVKVSEDACEQLRKGVAAMQAVVREGIKECADDEHLPG